MSAAGLNMNGVVVIEILKSMSWDASALDNIILNDVISDRTHATLTAIREHLSRYDELLRMAIP